MSTFTIHIVSALPCASRWWEYKVLRCQCCCLFAIFHYAIPCRQPVNAYCHKLCWVHMQNAAGEVGQGMATHRHPWHSDQNRHSLHWSVRCNRAHFDDCSISFQILEYLLSRRSTGHPGPLGAVPSSIVQEFLQRSYADVLRWVHSSLNST